MNEKIGMVNFICALILLSYKNVYASLLSHTSTHPICRRIPSQKYLIGLANNEYENVTSHHPIISQLISMEDYSPGQMTLVSALYEPDTTAGQKERYYALQILSLNGKPIESGRFKSATNGLKLKHCNDMIILVDKHGTTEEGVTFRWIPPSKFQGPLNILVSRIIKDEQISNSRKNRTKRKH